jgi:hypothetical protein
MMTALAEANRIRLKMSFAAHAKGQQRLRRTPHVQRLGRLPVALWGGEGSLFPTGRGACRPRRLALKRDRNGANSVARERSHEQVKFGSFRFLQRVWLRAAEPSTRRFLTPPSDQSPQSWINPAAFAIPAPDTFGDAERNLVRASGLWQVDAALSKTIGFTERLGLQFRAEVFNLFNRAQYGSPQANLSSPLTFGVTTTLVNQGATGSGTPR